MKSTTAPKRQRSMRFPTAPPKMRPRARAVGQPPPGRSRAARSARAQRAASDRSATTQRQPGGTAPRMPKARPGFITRVSAKRPSTTDTGPPSDSRDRARSFVACSRARMTRPTGSASFIRERGRRERSARRARGGPSPPPPARSRPSSARTWSRERAPPRSGGPPLPRRLERLGPLAPPLEEPGPLALEPLVEPLAGDLGEALEVHALAFPQVPPRLLGGEREDRRHQAEQRVQDLVARGLGLPP